MSVKMKTLHQFMSKRQIRALLGASGESGELIDAKVEEIGSVIEKMPKTYETDGQGDQAVAYLHYFTGGMDWYITERDMEEEQLQAFGLADLGHGGEVGYISIKELTSMNVELDLYWTPKTLAEIMAAKGA